MGKSMEKYHAWLCGLADGVRRAGDELAGLCPGTDAAQRAAAVKRLRKIAEESGETEKEMYFELIGAFLTPMDRGDLSGIAGGLLNCAERIGDWGEEISILGSARERQAVLPLCSRAAAAGAELSELVGLLRFFERPGATDSKAADLKRACGAMRQCYWELLRGQAVRETPGLRAALDRGEECRRAYLHAAAAIGYAILQNG